MAAGVTDKLWEIADIVALTEAKEAEADRARSLQKAWHSLAVIFNGAADLIPKRTQHTQYDFILRMVPTANIDLDVSISFQIDVGDSIAPACCEEQPRMPLAGKLSIQLRFSLSFPNGSNEAIRLPAS